MCNLCQCQMIAPIFKTSAVKQFPRECPASHPTGIGSVSTFAIWSWIPSATSGTRIRKIKGAAQRILWCRMRLWDSEWPRNWGLGWEGRLMVMLNARRPFSYRKLQSITIHEKVSPIHTSQFMWTADNYWRVPHGRKYFFSTFLSFFTELHILLSLSLRKRHVPNFLLCRIERHYLADLTFGTNLIIYPLFAHPALVTPGNKVKAIH